MEAVADLVVVSVGDMAAEEASPVGAATEVDMVVVEATQAEVMVVHLQADLVTAPLLELHLRHQTPSPTTLHLEENLASSSMSGTYVCSSSSPDLCKLAYCFSCLGPRATTTWWSFSRLLAKSSVQKSNMNPTDVPVALVWFNLIVLRMLKPPSVGLLTIFS